MGAEVKANGDKSCAACGASAKSKCSNCKTVYYCSTACQKSHWNEHKYACAEAKAAAAVTHVPAKQQEAAATPPAQPEVAPIPARLLHPYSEFLTYFRDKSLRQAPVGIHNTGNSCFANSVLQCLLRTRPLSAFWRQGRHKELCRSSAWCLLCELEAFANYTWSLQHGEIVSIKPLLLQADKIAKHFCYGRQEDAHEFLMHLLEAMERTMLQEYEKEEKLDARTRETTLVHHTFGGYLRNQTVCDECGHVSNTFECITGLTVDVMGTVDTLEASLRRLVAEEALEGDNLYQCDKCRKPVPAHKSTRLEVAPNVLQVCLKRSLGGLFGKLNNIVEYPERLSLQAYMAVGALDQAPTGYSLYGVIVHLDHQNSTAYGHYLCYVLSEEGQWFECDDTIVTPVDRSCVLRCKAYMLFYRRDQPRHAPIGGGSSRRARNGMAENAIIEDLPVMRAPSVSAPTAFPLPSRQPSRRSYDPLAAKTSPAAYAPPTPLPGVNGGFIRPAPTSSSTSSHGFDPSMMGALPIDFLSAAAAASEEVVQPAGNGIQQHRDAYTNGYARAARQVAAEPSVAGMGGAAAEHPVWNAVGVAGDEWDDEDEEADVVEDDEEEADALLREAASRGTGGAGAGQAKRPAPAASAAVNGAPANGDRSQVVEEASSWQSPDIDGWVDPEKGQWGDGPSKQGREALAEVTAGAPNVPGRSKRSSGGGKKKAAARKRRLAAGKGEAAALTKEDAAARLPETMPEATSRKPLIEPLPAPRPAILKLQRAAKPSSEASSSEVEAEDEDRKPQSAGAEPLASETEEEDSDAESVDAAPAAPRPPPAKAPRPQRDGFMWFVERGWAPREGKKDKEKRDKDKERETAYVRLTLQLPTAIVAPPKAYIADGMVKVYFEGKERYVLQLATFGIRGDAQPKALKFNRRLSEMYVGFAWEDAEAIDPIKGKKGAKKKKAKAKKGKKR